MPITLSCSCGKQLRLKDELAGKKVRCPACSAVVAVPAARTLQREDDPDVEERPGNQKPRSRGAEAPTPFWVRSNEILAVSERSIYCTYLNDKALGKAQTVLADGEPAVTALDGADTIIPFESIQKIQSNLYHEMIDVVWKEKGALEKTETTIQCADKEARDEVMEVLRERLGSGWRREVIELNRLRASLGPLAVIAVFGFLTFCFYMAGAHPEDDKSSGGTKVVRTNFIGVIFVWVYNLLGPWGVVILGSIFVAAGVAWLVARLITPPIMLTLTPRGAGKSPSR